MFSCLAIIYSFAGCSMGNVAVAGAGSAVNGDTTSPSAKARIIQCRCAPVVTGTRITAGC